MIRKESGSIPHSGCLRPCAISNTLLVVSESVCRSLALFKAITTNRMEPHKTYFRSLVLPSVSLRTSSTSQHLGLY